MTAKKSSVIKLQTQKTNGGKTKTKKPIPSADGKKWYIKFRLRNGLEESYQIAAEEKDHLCSSLRTMEIDPLEFFEFDTRTHRVLIQVAELMFCQFLFEPCNAYELANADEEGEGYDEEVEACSVRVYFVNDPSPVVFRVDVDHPNPEDEGDKGEMNNFIYFASKIDKSHQWLNFMDEDGETAFFRGSNIAMVEIPLEVLDIGE